MTITLKTVSRIEPPMWLAEGIIGRLASDESVLKGCPGKDNTITQIFIYRNVGENEIIYTVKSTTSGNTFDFLKFRLVNGQKVPKDREEELKQCPYYFEEKKEEKV